MQVMATKPNVVVIMTDQQRADVSRREGFQLDTTPFLDSLATSGTWFDRAYTTMPACLPARVSMLTGRYPSATHARTNHNREDAFFETDLYEVMRRQGYRTALCGKNHSHLDADRIPCSHRKHCPQRSLINRHLQPRASSINGCATLARQRSMTMPSNSHARSNYLGMLRLIDDQINRFFDYLDAKGLRDNTIVVFLSDHGDYVGEYGLVRKGAELPEVLIRIPVLVVGPGILASDKPHSAHVTTADIMPTLCEAIGTDIPRGVQGRSLWPLLTGKEYPDDEFDSAYAEHGFGGLHYAADDDYDAHADGLHPAIGFDELNGWSQSGTMRAIRSGDWKLVFDMQEHGQLYNLAEDPVELDDLFDHPDYADVQSRMLAKLLGWTLRVQDPLPHPRRRYKFKSDKRNYWSPYR